MDSSPWTQIFLCLNSAGEWSLKVIYHQMINLHVYNTDSCTSRTLQPEGPNISLDLTWRKAETNHRRAFLSS